jgi:hypothetical protein
LTLENRRELLAQALAKIEYPVLTSAALDAKPADLLRAAREAGLEGKITFTQEKLRQLSLHTRFRRSKPHGLQLIHVK